MVFFWVILYGMTYTISIKVPQTLHMKDQISGPVMLLYIVFFILWLYRTGQAGAVGLRVIRKIWPGEYLYLLPLVVLPLFNLLIATEHRIDFSAVALMLSVSIAEEIFFRGYMLRFFAKRSNLLRVVVTSVIFALFHGVNLIQNADITYTLMQISCAFATSVCYCAIALKFSSLLPCIISHVLTNITGISNLQHVENIWEMLGLWMCIAVYTGYGFWLCEKER